MDGEIMDILLNFIEAGKLVEIISVQGCDSMCKKIMMMGMSEGSIIKVIKNDSGPLIIKTGEIRLVIGRSMAQKVMVREV
ncbi:FeoA family protein [Clostridium estertheticum]|uniref:FeoA family protein n=1 Tax=Clostridium estertheticum TaxID=238834 RepID=UPI001CF53A7C|nr:FeoA domain-containing protein [Clostridium estertheticum]MCB2342631.1 FeoA domain-containing protein [Clostridium estertheticum]